MEITNQNFHIVMPYVTEALRECTFVSVDFEFTGVDRDRCQSENPEEIVSNVMRPPRDIYAAKRDVANSCTLIQIGFSIFTRKALAPTQHGAASPTPSSLASSVSLALAQFIERNRLAESTVLETFVKTGNELQQSLDSAKDLRSATTRLLQWTATTEAFYKKLLQELVEAAPLEQHKEEDASTAAATALVNRVARTNSCAVARNVINFVKGLEALASDVATALGTKGGANQSSKASGKSSSSIASDYYFTAQTFSAFLFPNETSTAFANIMLNAETTGKFLTQHGMDFNKWICGGLRYDTLDVYCEAREKAFADEVKASGAWAAPLQNVPNFRDCFTAGDVTNEMVVNMLLPFSAAEVAYLEWVLHLPTNRKEVAAHALDVIRFSRDREGSAVRDGLTVHLPDNLFREEVGALAQIGVRRERRKMRRTGAGSGGGNTTAGMNAGTGSAATASDSNATPTQVMDHFVQAEQSRCACAPPNAGYAFGGVAEPGSGVGKSHYGSELLATLLNVTQSQRKPVVVHNGLYDLIYWIRAMMGAVPDRYEDFKAVARTLFPTVYDTRALAYHPLLARREHLTNRLADTHRALTNLCGTALRVVHDPALLGGMDPAVSLKEHDAGFDAAITGAVFAYESWLLTLDTPRAADRAAYPFVPLVAAHAGFIPLFDSIFAVNLRRNDACDIIPAAAGSPGVYLYSANGTADFLAPSVRAMCREFDISATVTFSGKGYIVMAAGSADGSPLPPEQLQAKFEAALKQLMDVRRSQQIATIQLPLQQLVSSGMMTYLPAN